jgi:hypothetical protein
MTVQVRNQKMLEGQFRGIATRANVGNIEDVVVDFIGPYRNEKEAEDEDTGQAAPTVIDLDLSGKPINGGRK